MKQKIQENFPKSDIAFEEMVLGPDGKMRYIKPIRLALYQHLMALLQKKMNADSLASLSPFFFKKNPIIYFCMERWDIWEKIFFSTPRSIGELDYLFAASIYHRFGIGLMPSLELYEQFQHT